jgi:hypothetical protein
MKQLKSPLLLKLMPQLSPRNGRTKKLVEGMGSLILLGEEGIPMNQLWWYQILLSEQITVKSHMKFRSLQTSISRLNLTSKQVMLWGTVQSMLQKNMVQLTGKGGSMLRPPKMREVTIQMKINIEKAGKMSIKFQHWAWIHTHLNIETCQDLR